MLDTSPSADKLAALRARIGALQEQEARLSLDFIETGDTGVFEGRHCDVLVQREETREFAPDRLPVEIRRDPHYWKTRFRTQIKVREHMSAPATDMWDDGDIIDLVNHGGVYS